MRNTAVLRAPKGTPNGGDFAPGTAPGPGAPRFTYTRETADKVIEHYRAGLSLFKIGALAGLPGRGVILDWIEENRDGFGTRYQRARSVHADAVMYGAYDSAVNAQTGEEAQCAKVRAAVAARIAQAMDRATWGATVEHEHNTTQHISADAARVRLIEAISRDPKLLAALRAQAPQLLGAPEQRAAAADAVAGEKDAGACGGGAEGPGA